MAHWKKPCGGGDEPGRRGGGGRRSGRALLDRLQAQGRFRAVITYHASRWI
ncbi:hypothetical protein [Paracoccus sp. SSK6]|uniref:hypothetical protein n=1 Tax=Paracoccus sp. SSK6 TaxID=3143131 RepID=UPI00321BDEBD